MNDKTDRHTALIALVLALLMATTRSDHFAGEWHLPDGSAAVFFLAGVYLRPMWMLPALLVEAACIDYLAIAFGGVSRFCISPAYGFLLPAYGALWLAGRWYAKTSNKQVRHRFAFSTLLPLAAWVVIGGMVSELFSSGGFYFFSGGFEPNLAEFGARIAGYFPSSLAMLTFYVGIAAIVHAALDAVRHIVVTGRGTPPSVVRVPVVTVPLYKRGVVCAMFRRVPQWPGFQQQLSPAPRTVPCHKWLETPEP